MQYCLATVNNLANTFTLLRNKGIISSCQTNIWSVDLVQFAYVASIAIVVINCWVAIHRSNKPLINL